jgi:hypothetical protein
VREAAASRDGGKHESQWAESAGDSWPSPELPGSTRKDAERAKVVGAVGALPGRGQKAHGPRRAIKMPVDGACSRRQKRLVHTFLFNNTMVLMIF